MKNQMLHRDENFRIHERSRFTLLQTVAVQCVSVLREVSSEPRRAA
jgi:hypothetical protein